MKMNCRKGLARSRLVIAPGNPDTPNIHADLGGLHERSPLGLVLHLQGCLHCNRTGRFWLSPTQQRPCVVAHKSARQAVEIPPIRRGGAGKVSL